ncbi:MAG: hypothetical protein JW769_02320 [Parachlamydiales bacterium]|nr:hypothetical protein [Parachlamydiales bacterium]
MTIRIKPFPSSFYSNPSFENKASSVISSKELSLSYSSFKNFYVDIGQIITREICPIKKLKNIYQSFRRRIIQEKFSEAIHSQEEMTLSSQRKFDASLQTFPLWRLFIDYQRQAEGALAFNQTEPGYYASMQKAFSYLRNTLGKPIDIEELCLIHDLCVEKVTRINRVPFSLGFVTDSEISSYTLMSENVTQNAFKEWESQQLITTFNPRKHFQFRPLSPFLSQKSSLPENGHCYIYSTFSFTPIGKEKLKLLIQTYYENLERTEHPQNKLTAIATFCRALEILHVFPDGNQRTIAFALLTKLLLENDFSPAILKNPFMFDGYFSTEELVTQIAQGIETFQKYQQDLAIFSTSRLINSLL